MGLGARRNHPFTRPRDRPLSRRPRFRTQDIQSRLGAGVGLFPRFDMVDFIFLSHVGVLECRVKYNNNTTKSKTKDLMLGNWILEREKESEARDPKSMAPIRAIGGNRLRSGQYYIHPGPPHLLYWPTTPPLGGAGTCMCITTECSCCLQVQGVGACAQPMLSLASPSTSSCSGKNSNSMLVHLIR